MPSLKAIRRRIRTVDSTKQNHTGHEDCIGLEDAPQSGAYGRR